MSKYLRIAILEQEMLGTISTMMRLTIHINVMKSAVYKSPPTDILAKLHELRSHMEKLKAFSILLWKTRAVGEEFFLGIMASLEAISKQIVGWEKYITQQLLKKQTKTPLA
jgi:hypothetical protein